MLSTLLHISVRSEVGGHVAGLIDGEGCFVIRQSNPKRSRSWMCECRIHVRADDLPLLRRLQKELNIGRIHVGRRVAATEGRKDQPSVQWVVQKRQHCYLLSHLLTDFPLWSKKQRDFEIWQRALEAWPLQAWDEMERLGDELRETRRYR